MISFALAVRPYPVEIEHIGSPRAQAYVGCCSHIVIDSSASPTHNDLASIIPCLASAHITTFRPSPSPYTASWTLGGEDTASTLAAVVRAVSTANYHIRVASAQVGRPCSQSRLALRQQWSYASMGAIDARWAQYR
jgi:hypothetical protein